MTGSSTQGIKTVLHPVSDLAKAKAVYTALLGVAPQIDEAYYVGFEAAGQHIGLLPGGGPQGMTSPVAYWHVPDIEAKLAEVTAAGANVKEPCARRRWRPPGGHRHRPRRQPTPTRDCGSASWKEGITAERNPATKGTRRSAKSTAGKAPGDSRTRNEPR